MIRVGTDIVEIDRIKKSAQRQSFVQRVYSPQEREMFEGRSFPYPSMAGNWAAKEAFSKALGTGVRDFKLAEVQVLRDDMGAPYIKLSGNAEKIAQKMGLEFAVSISHSENYATAVVIAYTLESKKGSGGND